MIKFVRGNLFESKAEALVNTVNCVGVMGKGIAYQFKKAYPEMFRDYKARCKKKEIRLGEVTIFREQGRLIINFPTKGHWRSKSKLAEVEAGLRSLRAVVEEQGVTSVAVPPLGCGNGGLDWLDVRPLIERELGELEDVEIEVYEPAGSFQSKAAKEPKVSLSHFVLAALRTRIAKATKLKLQKAAYFFNVLSGTDYFKFTEHKYGPYCVAIDHMSRTIRDYLDYWSLKTEDMVDDGKKRRLAGTDVDRLENWLPAIEAASALCNDLTDSRLEAAATLHAVIAKQGPITLADATPVFLSWSPEKSSKFKERDVADAMELLEERGLVAKGLAGYEVASSAEKPDEIAITVRMPLSLANKLDELCRTRRATRSEVINEAVAELTREEPAGAPHDG